MGIHQNNPERKSDNEFISAELKHLWPGNTARLLDGRRTPGYIEEVWPDFGMFRWRITGFEDKGKCWDLRVEMISRFQVFPHARETSAEQEKKLKESVSRFNKELNIEYCPAKKEETESMIEERTEKAKDWLKRNSEFFKNHGELDFSSARGSTELARDLKRYLQERGLEKQEDLTAENWVLNPNSGEWFLGQTIVAAELGLTRYQGLIPRTGDIFKGEGEKRRRRDYLLDRLAFNRAFFGLSGFSQVSVYRGMATERKWKRVQRSFLSCTFSLEVARSFSGIEAETKFKNFYLIKLTVPIEEIFMTCLETEAMNRQYCEAEVNLFYKHDLIL